MTIHIATRKVAIIIHLLLYKYKDKSVLSDNLSVLIRYGFLAIPKPIYSLVPAMQCNITVIDSSNYHWYRLELGDINKMMII